MRALVFDKSLSFDTRRPDPIPGDGDTLLRINKTKNSLRLYLFFLTICLMWSISGCKAGQQSTEQEDPRKFSAQADAEASKRLDAIRAEIHSLKDHPWAGEYYFGDGLGVNVSLALAPQSGFLFEWHGCGGLYDRNYGTIASDGSHIVLHCDLENKHDGFEGISTDLQSLNWQDRRYLIGSDQWIDFCNEVNSGREQRLSMGRSARFLLRRGDEKKGVSSLPTIPAPYSSCLLARTLHAEVIEIDTPPKTKDADWPITLNVGRNDGAFVGMQLYCRSRNMALTAVEVTSIDSKTCKAIYKRYDSVELRPHVGEQLSTLFLDEMK